MSEPEHEVCTLCKRTRIFRRRLCRSCYRKLRACGCPLPPRRGWGNRRRKPLHPPREATAAALIAFEAGLVKMLRRWPVEARARLGAALGRVSSP